MPRASNPFFGGSVASNGVTYAVPERGNGLGGLDASSLKDIVAQLFYDPEKDPKVQQAGYYKSEAELNAAKIARDAKKDSDIEAAAKMDTSTPDGMRAMLVQLATAMDPDKVDDFARNFAAVGAAAPGGETGFSANVLQSLMAAGGNPLNATEDLLRPDHVKRLADEEALKRHEIGVKSADDRYGSDASAGASIAGSRIAAGQSNTNNLRDNRTAQRGQQMDVFSRAFADTMSYQKPTAAGAGSVATTIGQDGKREKTVVTAPIRPAPGRPAARPAASKADPLGIRSTAGTR
jgi:hypothetical protein